VYYYTDEEPPFDMDAEIAALKNKAYPPAPEEEATPVPTAVATPVPTAAPTAVATPEPEADNTGVLLIVALVLVGVVGYFMYTKKKPGKKKEEHHKRSEEE